MRIEYQIRHLSAEEWRASGRLANHDSHRQDRSATLDDIQGKIGDIHEDIALPTFAVASASAPY
jgi:hypothetical protein